MFLVNPNGTDEIRSPIIALGESKFDPDLFFDAIINVDEISR